MTKAFCFLAPYTLSFLLAGLTALGFYVGGLGFYWGVILFFVFHPLLDNLFFQKMRIENTLEGHEFWSRALLLSALPLLTFILVYSLSLARGLSFTEGLGLILSTGILMAVLGINIAHELVHRREKFLRAAGVYLLLLCHFGHWGISHVVGHHKNVATPEDPATSRKDETLYAYWPRAFFGGFAEVLRIESKRLHSRGWWRHRLLWYFTFAVAAAFTVFVVFGWTALFFWWAESLVAVLLLLTVDYIEHYGLLREINPATGHFEAMRAWHAWDSPQAFTNFALINLALHSNHHLKTALSFTELKEQEESRQLPFGYSAMALMALVPPLFFAVMNPRLTKHSK